MGQGTVIIKLASECRNKRGAITPPTRNKSHWFEENETHVSYIIPCVPFCSEAVGTNKASVWQGLLSESVMTVV